MELIFKANKKRTILITVTVLVILTLIFIFSNSLPGKEESSKQSMRIGELIKPFLELFLGKGNVTNHFIRKLAHFSEFCLLGLELAYIYRKIRFKPLFIILICALTDETIQIFSGRGPMIQDVWLDFAGGFFGFAVGVLIAIIVKRIKNRKGEGDALF